MRMLGAIEVEGGFGFQAKHIAGREEHLRGWNHEMAERGGVC